MAITLVLMSKTSGSFWVFVPNSFNS